VRKEPNGADHVRLTRREREIIGHLVAGFSTKAIAERLSISPRTVRNHVNNVLAKLGVHSRLEAVTYSIRNGLL
jgi:two-component system nitrate/nitrite response regulator NarL